MATSRAVIRRWTIAQIQIWKEREFDSEKDLFPLLEGIGSAWLFDTDDIKLVHRLPNLRPLWKENLSHVLRELVSEGIIKSVGNRGGSRYAIN